MDLQIACPYCKRNVSSLDYFCPNCGKKIKEKPLSTSLTKQSLIYLLSAFLPPMGIWPAIKYLRQPDKKSKKIGLIAIILTVASIVITLWLTTGFIKSFQKQLEKQLNPYQNLEV